VLQLQTSKPQIDKIKQAAVIFTEDGCKLTKQASTLDKKAGGFISKSIKSGRYTGVEESTITVFTSQLDDVEQVIVCGAGKKISKLTENGWRRLGTAVGKALDAAGVAEATIVMEEGTKELSTKTMAKAFVEGVFLSTYRFDCFKTKMKPHQKEKLKKLTVMLDDSAGFKKMIPAINAQKEGVTLARDLTNLPANVANPTYMMKEANKLSRMGVKVTILGEKEMKKLGMELLLAVGRASKQESRLIIMEYKGDKKSKKKHAVVGKGVMFDTGGYNLKPTAYMGAMKSDMGGAAAVMGLMKALAKNKSKANVIGVCGCVMNMIDGDGFLPSDIITGYNGQSVEIGNTDAEGRLVLADAISYIVDTKKPDTVIDVATLTGAVMSALGGFYAGIFSNNDEFAKELMDSGDTTGERLWRLPIDDGYAMKSKIADLNNDGTAFGGASAAAVFLKNFIDDKKPWVHLDIAAMAMADKIPGGPKIDGGTGFGVRLLFNHFNK